MKISDILTLHNTLAHAHSDSKKSALELISRLATTNLKTISHREALSNLIDREQLGSTGVGHGVALPHCRVHGIEKPIGALVQLAKAIDFESPDDEPVDLIFGLLLPKENTDIHLETLAALATRFHSPAFRKQLRHAKNTDELFTIALGNSKHAESK